MDSSAAKGCFIFFGIVLVIGLFGGLGVSQIFGAQFVDPQNGSIRMVQPSGIFANRDTQYAEHVNEPNSRANVNNAAANSLNAQATAIVKSSEVEAGKAQGLGFRQGIEAGVLAICGGLVLLVFGGIAIYATIMDSR